jgi:hypothetical protein
MFNLAKNQPSQDELIAAFNDSDATKNLCEKYQMSQQDLLQQAEELSNELSRSCTRMNIV